MIDRAVKENDRVVVSDFVNPTQFGPTEDLASYPRDLERDATLCENAGAALLFNPEPSEMYAEDACTFVDMSGLTGELCGKSRPIHFRGVCTVVSKLFHIVAPDRAYFGQKDAQQLSVIRRMVRDLNFDIEIIEKHHNQKIDAPSGTAIMLANSVNSVFGDTLNYEYDRHSVRRKRPKNEIGIHSVRGGTIVGEHEVIFAGHDEVIKICHSAQSREVFAVGAVRAAKFLYGKAPGLYDMNSIMNIE